MAWGNGETMRIDAALGEGWVFGAWLAAEPAWCVSAYVDAGDAACGA